MLNIKAFGATVVGTACFTVGLGVANLSSAQAASPFRLEYSVVEAGGLYDYEFNLILDNNTGTWTPGQEIDWIVFGDSPSGSSPLTNWIGDLGRSDSIVSEFSNTFGGHNGPTIFLGDTSPILPGWQPNAIGDTLKWAGTSTANLLQGQLLWSNIIQNTAGPQANFETAIRVPRTDTTPIPTPALLPGLIGMGIAAIRKRKAEQKETVEV